MEIVTGTSFEVESFIKVASLLVDCVDEDGSYAKDFGGALHTQECVFEERTAEAVALLLAMNRQAANEADGNWMIGLALGRPCGGIDFGDTAGGDGIVADD